MPVISALRGDILAVQLPHSILCCIRNGNIQLVFQHTNIKPDIGIRKAFAVSEQTLKRTVTEAVMEGLIGVLNIESDSESNSDPGEDVYSNYDSINNIDLPG